MLYFVVNKLLKFGWQSMGGGDKVGSFSLLAILLAWKAAICCCQVKVIGSCGG